MGFRDDLYTCENIIGYTGKLHAAPTVYFISEELQLVGHITQQHHFQPNIGRQRPIKMQGYSFGNEINQAGRKVLVERFHNNSKHESRNPLIYVGYHENGRPQDYAITMETIAILASAIYALPNEKYISALTRPLFKKLVSTQNANTRMMKELKHLNKVAQQNDMSLQEISTMGNLNDFRHVNFRGRR